MAKNRFKWCAALVMCCAMLAGCDKDEKQISKQPSARTVAAFEAKFPNALNVQWSKKHGYDVATFGLAARATEAKRNTAWYPEGGTVCTYTKFEITWAQLQTQAPAVAAAWNASTYKTQGYALDDIDVKSYADAETLYKLEIEKGEIERELVYKADGTLLSDREDIDDEDEDDEDDPSPQGIIGFIADYLPNAVIIDTDTEREGGKLYYEVEVRIGNIKKELIFNDKLEFLYILVEVDERDYAKLPELVYERFIELASDTDDWDVYIREDITETTTGYILIVEDERLERETTYIVNADGNLIDSWVKPA